MSDITPNDTAASDPLMDAVQAAETTMPHLKTVEEMVMEIWHKVHAIEQHLIGQTPAGTVTVVHQ